MLGDAVEPAAVIPKVFTLPWRGELALITMDLPTRKMDTDEERERKGGSVSVSISFFSGAGFNKPLGRK